MFQYDHTFFSSCSLFEWEFHLIKSKKKIRLVSNFVRIISKLNDDGLPSVKIYFNKELKKHQIQNEQQKDH